MTRYVLTLSCVDRPGIVNAVTGGLLEVGGNIVQSSQFGDDSTGRFFLRMQVDAADDVAAVRSALEAATAHLDGDLAVRPESQRCRTILMVSKFDHCLVDLLYRWKLGELPVDVVGVVSNHPDCREIVESYGIAYHHVPVTPETKPDAEAALLRLVDETNAELVVLARYMQVLSNDLCRALQGRAINIHHSFLPSFKGARPYAQAHDRGVKLIGATAHYVTGDLDEGPIIEQDVERVDHTRTVEDLVRLGQDVERRALARAVRWHAEHRVLLDGHRTIVFR